jgi:hypothetical protein
MTQPLDNLPPSVVTMLAYVGAVCLFVICFNLVACFRKHQRMLDNAQPIEE